MWPSASADLGLHKAQIYPMQENELVRLPSFVLHVCMLPFSGRVREPPWKDGFLCRRPAGLLSPLRSPWQHSSASTTSKRSPSCPSTPFLPRLSRPRHCTSRFNYQLLARPSPKTILCLANRRTALSKQIHDVFHHSGSARSSSKRSPTPRRPR
jgi:hypothetical protein